MLARNPPLFGVNIDPSLANVALAERIALRAERLAFDFAGIQDHPYISSHLDSWTLLVVLAARTSRLRFIPNVLSLPLRPPAQLAKAAATLDVLTRGRVEIGIGAGAMWDGIASFGGPRRTPGEAVVALREGIEIMRLFWASASSGTPIDYHGQFYNVTGARPGPPPAHEIRIWLGALKPRMLDLTGSHGDGWLVSVPYVPPQDVPALQARIDGSAERAGRDPAAIRRGYNVMGVVTLPGKAAMRPNRPGTIVGTAEQWIETLAGYYRDIGMDTFFFWPLAGDEEAQIQAFSEQIIPGVRAAVAAA
ncbi:MAG: LLM class flavin-dependent oxidoreductase [Chloroflexi bacterium]|nr:MAG: LLM class flavin-dependent oxidoreductase [Chloroflexota bacterium]